MDWMKRRTLPLVAIGLIAAAAFSPLISAESDLEVGQTVYSTTSTAKIDSLSLAVDPTAGSLATFVASGGTALGTALADSKSIVDAIGTNGTTVADTATGIAGMIGVNDADNAMDTSTVAANADGSVFERLEYLQGTRLAGERFTVVSAVTSSAIPNNAATAPITAASSGGILVLQEVVVQCDGTGLAAPTNIEVSTDNTNGLTGVDAPIIVEVIASFGANATMISGADATTKRMPMVLETGSKLYVHGDDAAGTGAGVCNFYMTFERGVNGATVAAADVS